MPDWSSKLAKQFHLKLPASVVNWYDDEVWKQWSQSTSFGEPIEPDALLAPDYSAVMGGLMLPDSLPILGNGCGDAICLRFDCFGQVIEAIRWSHEGGNWTPYGKSLCEALLLDAVVNDMNSTGDHDVSLIDEVGFASWALEQLARSGLNLRLRQIFSAEQTISMMGLKKAGIATVGVARILSERNWTSGLLKYCLENGGSTLAEMLKVDWSTFSEWLFDTALIPDNFKRQIVDGTQTPLSELLRQDWNGAAQEAETVANLRSDLSWPFSVLGWAAERQGNVIAAIEHYSAGITALGTTAEFTERWVAGNSPSFTKFPFERLKVLIEGAGGERVDNEYFQSVKDSKDPGDFFARVRNYWCDCANVAEQDGRFADACNYYYRAGWDILVMDDMDTILDGIVRNAEAGGWRALAAIARAHRQNLM